MVVELVLKTLVGVVDAELLVRVDLEALKAVDVENTDHGLARLRGAQCERSVHLVDKPVEETGVDILGDRVTHHDGLGLGQVGDDLFASGLELLLDGPFAELGRIDTEHAGGHKEAWLVICQDGIVSCSSDLDVAEMQERGQETKDVPLTLDGETDRAERLLCRLELLGIVDAVDDVAASTALVEVEEFGSILETEVLSLGGRCACTQLVEDVVVSLRLGLVDETRALEQVGAHLGTDNLVALVE